MTESKKSVPGVFGLVTAFILGMMLSNWPATVNGQLAAATRHGKCIAVIIQGHFLYRAFENGDVEEVDVTNGKGRSWRLIGSE